MTKKEFEHEFKKIHSSLITYIMKYGKINRDDACDIAQFTAYNSYKYLVVRNNHINYSFKTFVYTVARNELVDNIRRSRINSKHELNFSSFKSEDNNFNIEELLKSEAFDECYDKALNKVANDELCKLLLDLKDKSKTYFETLCLNLIYEKDYKECAEILNIPIGTVKSRIFKAKKFLKDNVFDSFRDIHNI